jgi:hypothetical protein
MEWFAVIIPIITAGFLYVFWKKSVLWWEPVLSMLVTALVILIMKCSMQAFMYSDTEYWTAPITKATYYEDWNEYIHQTCTRSHTDANGRTTTETYDCSYVAYHGEYWEIVDAIGNEVRVTESEFKRLVMKFGNHHFVDMHRDYYTNDGNAYSTVWNGSDRTLDPCVTEHRYENRVASTNTVFRFREIDDSLKAKQSLFDYPSITDNHLQSSILTDCDLPGLDSAQHQMNILNSRLGPSVELKTWLLIWRGGTLQTGIDQQHLWKGGNKNEMVICIGVDDTGKPLWCHPFSWTEKHDNEIAIRDWILSQKQLQLTQLLPYMQSQLSDFKRKNFDEFSYLEADLTSTQLIWIWIVVLLLNVGAAYWIIVNEFNDDENTYTGTWSRFRHFNR